MQQVKILQKKFAALEDENIISIKAISILKQLYPGRMQKSDLISSDGFYGTSNYSYSTTFIQFNKNCFSSFFSLTSCDAATIGIHLLTYCLAISLF